MIHPRDTFALPIHFDKNSGCEADMGGFGSGRWERATRKETVEESLTLCIDDLRHYLRPDVSGKIRWTSYDGSRDDVAFFVSGEGEKPRLTLSYRVDGQHDVSLQIHFTSTPTNFGGRRLWFACPMMIDGVPCDRTVGTLHLPPSSTFFGCRTCHDLTYQSCRESSNWKRLPDRIRSMQKFLERRNAWD